MNLLFLIKLPITNPKKQLMIFFIGWIGLFVSALFISLLLQLGIATFYDPSEANLILSSTTFLSWINFLSYASLFALVTLLISPWLKETFWPALRSGKWLLGVPFTFAILFSSVFIATIYEQLGIPLESNQNQEAIIGLVNQMPVISFLTFVFLGPIMEEWTYRLGLFQYLKGKNTILAYLLTLTLFGFIHFDFSATNLLNELYNLPIYLMAGAWFCFLYHRYGLQVAMSAHIMNNLLSVLTILFPISEWMSSSL